MRVDGTARRWPHLGNDIYIENQRERKKQPFKDYTYTHTDTHICLFNNILESLLCFGTGLDSGSRAINKTEVVLAL